MVKQQHRLGIIIVVAVAVLTVVITSLAVILILYFQVYKPTMIYQFDMILQIHQMLQRIIMGSISKNLPSL
jgi:phosphatidylglycerophosphatase A